MRRVVLFYPSLINGDESPTLYTALPLSLVALAAPLRAASFEVEILDERLHIYTEEEIGKQLEGAVLVGISAITSYQIVNGLRFARSVRRLAPHIPIVWGGWHPTLMPMETLRHPLVSGHWPLCRTVRWSSPIHCAMNCIICVFRNRTDESGGKGDCVGHRFAACPNQPEHAGSR